MARKPHRLPLRGLFNSPGLVVAIVTTPLRLAGRGCFIFIGGLVARASNRLVYQTRKGPVLVVMTSTVQDALGIPQKKRITIQ